VVEHRFENRLIRRILDSSFHSLAAMMFPFRPCNGEIRHPKKGSWVMENSVHPQLIEGRTGFFIHPAGECVVGRPCFDIAQHERPTTNANGSFRVKGTNQAKSAKLMTFDSLTPINS
jgi:hypothetical protein